MRAYNYYELVKIIERVSLSHEFVNSVYIHLYSSKLNSESDIEYPAIVITPNQHQIGSQISTWSFNMLYVDILKEKQDNWLEIQSVGIDTVNEILNALSGNDLDLTIEMGNVTPFKRQFANNGAGAVTTFTVETLSNLGKCEWIEICDNDC